MLSAIIATLDSERPLLPTLAALVPGVVDGVLREVIVADGGSRDGTASVADAAGCRFLVAEGPLGRRLNAAAAAARAPHLLFLRPGVILDAAWTGESRGFIEQSPPESRAAVFRRGAPTRAAYRDVLPLLAALFGALPRPEQGLLLAREFYDALGGCCERAADAETELIRRIGRRRIVTLATAALSARL